MGQIFARMQRAMDSYRISVDWTPTGAASSATCPPVTVRMPTNADPEADRIATRASTRYGTDRVAVVPFDPAASIPPM
jgi:hypothetical protein